MAILPVQLARVSNLLRTSTAEQSISRTQRDLLRVQNELSTGKKLNSPSDAPGDAAVVLQLQKTLEQRLAYGSNISQATGQLGEVDTALGDLTSLLQEAQTVASANAGSDVTADQRASAAAIVQSLYSQAVSLGNKQYNGTYVFGGDRGTTEPFVATDGGVKFVGSSTVLQNRVDENRDAAFMIDGEAVFGATSSRVRGSTALAPSLSPQTRLADLGGAGGKGVRPGVIRVGNGTVDKLVDLSRADTVGDVVNAINAAGVGGITATLTGGGLTLSGAGGDNITVTEAGMGKTAADLGIATAGGGAGAGVAVAGANVKPRVTSLTKLSDLRGGAGIDLAAGIVIKNGEANVTVNFTSPPLRTPATVEDLLNTINNSEADVRASINADGTGIDIVNPNQGTAMTIGENGGTTAADLGVRTLSGNTTLAEMNGGKGVGTVDGDDMQFTRTNGTTFNVDLTGAANVQDVINRINAADTVNGTQPASVVADLADNGNGIRLTDSSGGGGTLAVAALNFSTAADDLGLTKPAATAANSITSADRNHVAAEGIFANLARLRDALEANDQADITASAEALQVDYDRVVRTRGVTGAKVQELEARQERLADQNVATESMLSSLADADMAETISRFQTLQTSLQAAMQAAGKTLNLSLMDFLG